MRERDSILRSVRAEAEASLSELRRELDQVEAEMRVRNGTTPSLLPALRERIDQAAEQAKRLVEAPTVERLSEVERPTRALSHRPAPQDRGIEVGDRVMVSRTGQEGVVSSAPPGRGELEVQIGPFKTRVKLKDVRLVARGEDASEVDETRYNGGTRIQLREGPAPSLEFDMRGWRADEVAPELERYINDAFMSNMPFVRIIHGKGTGALRQVVREELATNPLVSSFKTAEAREGGEGVTIAQLAV
jgi:DNA mismatch repair protein MutS2